MLILILFLILLLPVAFLPLALKASFSSDELLEMGVYIEGSEPKPVSSREDVNSSQSGSLYPCAA